MESNYESHDYGYGGYVSPPCSYSSESRESHEEYVPTPVVPRVTISNQTVRTTTPVQEQKPTTKRRNTGKKKKYNSLEDIDKLIERLEKPIDPSITGERANQILAERKEKVRELKSLVAEARKEEAVAAMLKELEEENKEADAAIVYIKGKNGKRI